MIKIKQITNYHSILIKFFLLLFLLPVIFAIFIALSTTLSRADQGPIPNGYSALQYIQTLQDGDKNKDGVINSIDYAYALKRYGTKYDISHFKFGSNINSLETSFLLSEIGTSVVSKTTLLLRNLDVGTEYSEGIIYANETKINTDKYIIKDNEFNEVNQDLLSLYPEDYYSIPLDYISNTIKQPFTPPTPTPASTTSAMLMHQTLVENGPVIPGSIDTGSKGADSGRTLVPSILGDIALQTGDATFSLPIVVPKGPGGFGPQLALSYSSGSIDDVLPYDDRYVAKYNGDTPVNEYFYKQKDSYTPFFAGYGFSLTGTGSITRDTRQEKDIWMRNGEPHHRYILTLPSGLSAQLKYNTQTGRWTSIPEGFITIKHNRPEKIRIPSNLISDSNQQYDIVDPGEWEITTVDGTKYFFGEQNFISTINKTNESPNPKINIDGRIIGSKDVTLQGSENNYLHHTYTENGTGIYNEFDIADLCKKVNDSDDSCAERENENHPAMLITKWLLREIQSPDGKSIQYNYDSYQKAYLPGNDPRKLYRKTWDNALLFTTVDSYLFSIDWNDDKYRVELEREQRSQSDDTRNLSDMGSNKSFLMKDRLSKIKVMTKLKNKNLYDIVRSYTLAYANDSSVMSLGNNNEWGISLLSKITEKGVNETQAAPTISFTYKQIGFEDGPSGSTIFLNSINNGMGGITSYEYERFNYALVNVHGSTKGAPRRVRVIEKNATDTTPQPNGIASPRTIKTKYNYKIKDDKGVEWGTHAGFADRIRGDKVSGREFLGHAYIEAIQYDFDGSTILSHTQNYFYTSNGIWDNNRIVNVRCDQPGGCQKEKRPGWTCFKPHIAEGKPYQTITLNHYDKNNQSKTSIANQTNIQYQYRTVKWNENIPEFISDLDVNETCTHEYIHQPYFVYTKKTISQTKENVDTTTFIPSNASRNLKESIKNELYTASENISFDTFGNITKSVQLGNTTPEGNDIDLTDNRYSYANYLTQGGEKWIKNLPYATYMSNMDNCYTQTYCQYGLVEYWYDQFDRDFLATPHNTQNLQYGLLTQKKTWIETDSNHDNVHNDPTIAITGIGYDKLKSNPDQYGNIVAMYGPKPNIKTSPTTSYENLQKNTITISTTKFDDYFHTLPEVSTSSGLITTKYQYESDLNTLLQLPSHVKTQRTKGKEEYIISKAEYDSLGRKIATYLPDQNNPDTIISKPNTLTVYFDQRGTNGLAVRSSTATSMTNTPNPSLFNAPETTDKVQTYYATSDIFYDGFGNIKQTQTLSTNIGQANESNITGLQEVSIIAESTYNGAGNISEIWDIQTSTANTNYLSLPGNTTDALRLLSENEPVFKTDLAHIVTDKTEYDTLQRPIKHIKLDPEKSIQYETTTQYAANAQKIINPKGTVALSTLDVWGRTIDVITFDKDSKSQAITQNEYQQPLLDQPTKTTYLTLESIPNHTGPTKTAATVVYDKSGRILETYEPSNGKYEFSYDVLGNKMREGDKNIARRYIYEFRYDNLNRVTHALFPNASQFNNRSRNLDRIVYTYDTKENGLGLLSNVQHFSGSQDYEYDKLQRKKTITSTVLDQTRTYSSEYNDLSQITKSTYPDNVTNSFTYDKYGLSQKISLNNNPMFDYSINDKYGSPYETGLTFANKQYVSRVHSDALKRPKGLGFAQYLNSSTLLNSVAKTDNIFENATNQPLSPVSSQPNLKAILYQGYNYNNYSELTPIYETLYNPDGTIKSKRSYEYTYDNFSQLTGVKAENIDSNNNKTPYYTSSYNYDVFGRIAQKAENQSITYNYNASFPFFAPKIVTIPLPKQNQTNEIPTPTISVDTDTTDRQPTQQDTQETQPTSILQNTTIPRYTSTPQPTTTPEPTQIINPTQGPPQPTTTNQCIFNPITSVKELLPDNSLRYFTTEETNGWLTSNNKRIEKHNPEYITDKTKAKKELWRPFTDGKYIPQDCSQQESCNIKTEYCCVDAENKPPYGYEIQKGDVATVTLDFFDENKYEIVDRTCLDLDIQDNENDCPTDPDNEKNTDGSLKYTNLKEYPNLQVACNKQYEYTWVLKKKETNQAFAQQKDSDYEQKTINLSYDTKGMLREDHHACYEYNMLGQLRRMSIKKDTSSKCWSSDMIKSIFFYYDHESNLVAQEEFNRYIKGLVNPSNPEKITYYFGNYEYSVETKDNEILKTQTRHYFPIGGTAAYELTTSKNNNGQTTNSSYLLVKDYLASTKIVINENGNYEYVPEYYPYGSLLDKQNNPFTITDRAFTGHKLLNGSNDLYQFGSRFYSPTLGLFIQPDIAQGPHRYQYANNNPTNVNDPSGNFVNLLVGAGIGAGLEIVSQVVFDGARSIDDIKWTRVGIAAASGAVGVGIAGQVGKLAVGAGARLAIAKAADIGVGTAATLTQGAIEGQVSKSDFARYTVETMAVETAASLGFEGLSRVGKKLFRSARETIIDFIEDESGTLFPKANQYGRRIGGGAYGHVYVKGFTATKLYNDEAFADPEVIDIEISLMKQYGGKYNLLPQFKGEVFDADGKVIGYQMERLFGKNLKGIKKHSISQWDVDIAEAKLQRLHSEGFLHLDLEENRGNVMVTRRGGTTTIRLIDPFSYVNPRRTLGSSILQQEQDREIRNFRNLLAPYVRMR